MTVIDLKKLLIHRIEEIDDEEFLNAIKTILDSKSQSQKLVLNKEQLVEIVESKKQISEGLYIDQSQVDKNFEKWLSVR
ncbi:MAG: hypothetical protein ACWA6U_00705 [Breznakibacter sp.]